MLQRIMEIFGDVAENNGDLRDVAENNGDLRDVECILMESYGI